MVKSFTKRCFCVLKNGRFSVLLCLFYGYFAEHSESEQADRVEKWAKLVKIETDFMLIRCFGGVLPEKTDTLLVKIETKERKRGVKMERFLYWFFIIAGLYYAWYCLMGGLYVGAILFLLLVVFSATGLRGNKEK